MSQTSPQDYLQQALLAGDARRAASMLMKLRDGLKVLTHNERGVNEYEATSIDITAQLAQTRPPMPSSNPEAIATYSRLTWNGHPAPHPRALAARIGEPERDVSLLLQDAAGGWGPPVPKKVPCVQAFAAWAQHFKIEIIPAASGGDGKAYLAKRIPGLNAVTTEICDELRFLADMMGQCQTEEFLWNGVRVILGVGQVRGSGPNTIVLATSCGVGIGVTAVAGRGSSAYAAGGTADAASAQAVPFAEGSGNAAMACAGNSSQILGNSPGGMAVAIGDPASAHGGGGGRGREGGFAIAMGGGTCVAVGGPGGSSAKGRGGNGGSARIVQGSKPGYVEGGQGGDGVSGGSGGWVDVNDADRGPQVVRVGKGGKGSGGDDGPDGQHDEIPGDLAGGPNALPPAAPPEDEGTAAAARKRWEEYRNR